MIPGCSKHDKCKRLFLCYRDRQLLLLPVCCNCGRCVYLQAANPGLQTIEFPYTRHLSGSILDAIRAHCRCLSELSIQVSPRSSALTQTNVAFSCHLPTTHLSMFTKCLSVCKKVLCIKMFRRSAWSMTHHIPRPLPSTPRPGARINCAVLHGADAVKEELMCEFYARQLG